MTKIVKKLDANLAKSSKYPMSRLAAKFEPIDQESALVDIKKTLGNVTHGKLSVIVDQIRYLQEQAKKIIFLEEKNMELHKASCQFEKRIGQTYYLYARGLEELYFSLLSPNDWGGNPPHTFKGSYHLEPDMSWSEVLDNEELV